MRDDPDSPPDTNGDRPLYKRPGLIIGAVVLLLLLAVIVAPVIADPAPVGFTDEGTQNAQDDSWRHEDENGPETMTLLGGFVVVDPVQFVRENDQGITSGMYLFSSVKIGAMIPHGLVADQLHSAAQEQIAQSGVDLQQDPTQETTFTANGQDMDLRFYQGTLGSNTGVFGGLSPGTEVDLFVATWPCGILGNHAVAVGAAPQGNNSEDDDGGFTLPGTGFDSNGNFEGADIHEIKDNLLAHTICNP